MSCCDGAAVPCADTCAPLLTVVVDGLRRGGGVEAGGGRVGVQPNVLLWLRRGGRMTSGRDGGVLGCMQQPFQQPLKAQAPDPASATRTHPSTHLDVAQQVALLVDGPHLAPVQAHALRPAG